MRPRRDGDIGAGEQLRDHRTRLDEPGEADRQADRSALQPGTQRTVAGDDQPGVDAACAKLGEGIDAAVDALFDGQPAAVHDQRPARTGQPQPGLPAVAARVEGFEVDAEWHGDDVRRTDALELRPRETCGAQHSVVVGRRAPVGEVGDPARQRAGQDLAGQPVEPFVGDHHRADPATHAPRSQRAESEPVGHLDGVGSQLFEQPDHRGDRNSPVTSGQRNAKGRESDPAHPGGQPVGGGLRAGDDQPDLVAGRAVLGAESVDRGAQPARPRTVEVGDLDDAHHNRLPRPGVGRPLGHRLRHELPLNSQESR